MVGVPLVSLDCLAVVVVVLVVVVRFPSCETRIGIGKEGDETYLAPLPRLAVGRVGSDIIARQPLLAWLRGSVGRLGNTGCAPGCAWRRISSGEPGACTDTEPARVESSPPDEPRRNEVWPGNRDESNLIGSRGGIRWRAVLIVHHTTYRSRPFSVSCLVAERM